ncbi:hypothetical protein ACGFNU_10780 [Spirillospora sp. NPDC048911]|uniref:hypothetical protein n=1 Tax=Spirillospora sp. NPDC048911 TaxID=3364527 RepID=UPI003722BBB6
MTAVLPALAIWSAKPVLCLNVALSPNPSPPAGPVWRTPGRRLLKVGLPLEVIGGPAPGVVIRDGPALGVVIRSGLYPDVVIRGR